MLRDRNCLRRDHVRPQPARLKENAMKIEEALVIVLELARQNVISQDDEFHEHARQTEACDQVEDMIVNQFGEVLNFIEE
jgi:hypothetical protein